MFEILKEAKQSTTINKNIKLIFFLNSKRSMLVEQKIIHS